MIEKNRALVAVLAFATIASSILILKYRMQKSKHFKWIFNYFSPCRKKNITEVSEMLGDDSFLVCLTFEPAGRAVNQCAVCGATEKYNRKNIIPFEYRKFFSPVMYASQNVVVLCQKCHHISNMYDSLLRDQLAIECDAPLSSVNDNRKEVEVSHMKQLKCICRAMYYHHANNILMPEEQKNVLLNLLKMLCDQHTEFFDEILLAIVTIEISGMNENCLVHGVKVVEFYQNSRQGVAHLEQKWREHFLKTMKPSQMSILWSVEHDTQRQFGN